MLKSSKKRFDTKFTAQKEDAIGHFQI